MTMTKPQRKRLAISQQQLVLLRRIRFHELENSGRGVEIETIIDGRTGRQIWLTMQSLVRRELIKLDHENRVRTTGLAREMNGSWQLTATGGRNG